MTSASREIRFLEPWERPNNVKRTHETRRVGWVGADLVVDFDKALVDD